MKSTIKVGGAALIGAALLNLTRMIPMALSEGFEPALLTSHDPADAARLALLSGWLLSHLMIPVSIALFFTAFISLYQGLSEHNQGGLGLIATATLSLGAGFYAIAGVLDGLAVPVAAEHFVNGPAGEKNIWTAMITQFHDTATSFGGLGFTALLIGSGFLGFGLSRGYQRPLLGAIGMVLAVLAILGYGLGLLDIRIKGSLFLTLPLVGIMFMWFVAVGVLMMRGLNRVPSK